jgi:hypothetical protein
VQDRTLLIASVILGASAIITAIIVSAAMHGLGQNVIKAAETHAASINGLRAYMNELGRSERER